MNAHPIIEALQNALAKGALEKGGTWGGVECSKAVPLTTHIVESSCWILFCLIIARVFNFRGRLQKRIKAINSDLVATPLKTPERLFEVILGTIHFIKFFMIIYYKSNIRSTINIIQPCHMILLLQGIALLSTDAKGVLITSLMLPALTGTLLAMIFPETNGLTQPFELDAYWLQHYFIQSVPIYLLIRRNGLALRHAGMFQSAFIGLWILAFLHFSVYEFIDVLLSVNVEFMLCPTSAMDVIFPMFPAWMFLPSYRSTLTVFVCLIGTIITWIYLTVAYILRNHVLTKKKLV